MNEKDIKISRDGLNLAAKVSLPKNSTFDLAILAYGFVGEMNPRVNNLLPEIADKLQKEV